MTSRILPSLAFAALACATTLSPVAAFADEEKLREATIIVSGEGEAKLAPDLAVLSLSVLREAPTAAEALAANTEAMGKVIAELKAGGIEARDLQTRDFSVTPRYRDRNDDEQIREPEIIGYAVTNGLTVRVRDLGKLGAIIDQSVRLGVNQGGSIVFTNDKPDAAISEARKAAAAEAIAKAKTLAEAAGVTLGRVVEISENFARPMPQPMFRAAMEKDMIAGAPAPIEAGENSYSVTVNITYAIKQ
ncbi:SIMPL domain-containing protein [Ciceribacter thiooxidans]|uniref:SIMPL domain-containing protein n=1 Tax=Ciceribacter thiooxidans TaxID=1969821 RepID=A0ABV7I1L6_9HYPH|nr:SIMPL domain-containing protein [Ciceribacter thiooxidans]